MSAGLSLALGATLLTLAGLELALRWTFPQDALLGVNPVDEMLEPAGGGTPYYGHPEFGAFLKPHIRYRETAPEFSVEITTNSDGFRAPEFSATAKAGRPVAVATGDSYLWGYGVPESERMLDLVSSRIPEFAWLNLSAPGTGTDQHYLYWKHVGSRYHPQLVVEFVYPNDLVDNVRSFRNFPKPRFRPGPGGEPGAQLIFEPVSKTGGDGSSRIKKLWMPLDRWLRNRSHLFVLLKGRIAGLRGAGSGNVERSDDLIGLYRRPRPAGMQAAVELLQAELAMYGSEVKASGARFVVVLVPHKWEMETDGVYISDDWGTVRRMMKLDPSGFDLASFSAGMQAWGKQTGVPVYPLREVLKNHEIAGERVYFLRDGHWSKDGNRIVADEFVRGIWPQIAANAQVQTAEGVTP